MKNDYLDIAVEKYERKYRFFLISCVLNKIKK